MKLTLSQLAAIGATCGLLCSCGSSRQRIDYSWFRDTVTAAQEDVVTVEAGEGLAEALPASEAPDFTPPPAPPTPPKAAPKEAPQAVASAPAEKKPRWYARLFGQNQKKSAPPAVQGTYMVQKGDVLSAIARRHRVSTAALAKANKLANPNALRIGQVLVIPGAGTQAQPAASPAPVAPATAPPSTPAPAVAPAPAPTPAAQPAAAANYYTVCAGDTLARIARRYNTTIQKIMQANNMTEAQAHRLSIGQRILLPRN